MFGEIEQSGHDRMSLWRLIVMNFCLGMISLASCFNGVIAISLIITFAATIIKFYKLDPEPFFLLSIHAVTSFLMLHDATTSMAVIIAVSTTCMTTGSVDISSERIAVFLTSMAITSLLGRVAASVLAITFLVVIIAVKLRPLRPASNSVLVLLLLAASVPMNGHVTPIMTIILIASLSIWYIARRFSNEIDQFHAKTEMLYLDHPTDNHNNNNNMINNINNNISNNLMKGGLLKLCNTTDSLDLHGHTVTSALKTLHQFLKEHEDSFRRNRTGHTRYLRVITGEDGKNHAEDNLNLIKPTVVNFLKINKYRYQVNSDRPGILKIDLESHVK